MIPSPVASDSVKLMDVSFANTASEELYLAAHKPYASMQLGKRLKVNVGMSNAT